MTFCATAWALSGTNFVPGLRLRKFRSFCTFETGSGASILLPVTQHWLAERLGGGLGMLCPFQWPRPAWGGQMWLRRFVVAAPEEKTGDYRITTGDMNTALLLARGAQRVQNHSFCTFRIQVDSSPEPFQKHQEFGTGIEPRSEWQAALC